MSGTTAADFTAARRALLARIIAKHGGRIASSPSEDSVTHIIQSGQTSPKDTIGADPDRLYTPEWVVDALKHNRLPGPGRHRWRPPAVHEPPAGAAADSLSDDEEPPLSLDEGPAAGTTANGDMNRIVTDVLDKLASAENALGNVYEGIAYERARNIVRALREPMRTEADVVRLLGGRPGIGTKLLSRIKEVVTTGASEKLMNLETDERVQAVTTFMQIWGVGQKLALDLYHRGCRTLDDVRAVQDALPPAVQKSLRVHEELQVKMPRDEVRQLADAVEGALRRRSPRTVLTVCGSFRRQAAMCGDIDMIVNPIGPSSSRERYAILSGLIADLSATGFLTDHLAMPTSTRAGKDQYSYMGIAQLRPDALHRRIDIKIYPEEQMPFALAYFTGDSQFVRKMRLHARKKGYSLSDHGLYPVRRGPEGKQLLGASVSCPDEKDIFKHLGIVWVEPGDRANATVELVDGGRDDGDGSKSDAGLDDSSLELQTIETSIQSKRRRTSHQGTDQ